MNFTGIIQFQQNIPNPDPFISIVKLKQVFKLDEIKEIIKYSCIYSKDELNNIGGNSLAWLFEADPLKVTDLEKDDFLLLGKIRLMIKRITA